MKNSNLKQFDDSTETFPREITAQDFLEHTAPAVKALFDAIAKEEARYAPLKHSLNGAEQAHWKTCEHGDFNDDVDPSRIQFHFHKAAEAKMQALLISQSIKVLYGAILQIARQAISLIFEDKDRFLKGKNIGTQPLSAVIWHGRNQAMHWEVGAPTHDNSINCFNTLAKEFGQQFKVGGTLRNFAWDICRIIGWSSYENYAKDMQEILEEKNGGGNLSSSLETI